MGRMACWHSRNQLAQLFQEAFYSFLLNFSLLNIFLASFVLLNQPPVIFFVLLYGIFIDLQDFSMVGLLCALLLLELLPLLVQAGLHLFV